MNQNRHLVFYDGLCGLCDHMVQLLLKIDKKEQFLFAPLQGNTARSLLAGLTEPFKQLDSLILVENFGRRDQKIYMLGKGVWRIFWLLGGLWKILGAISFLPSFLYDWSYRLIARHRKIFFKNERCIIPSESNKRRFLP